MGFIMGISTSVAFPRDNPVLSGPVNDDGDGTTFCLLCLLPSLPVNKPPPPPPPPDQPKFMPLSLASNAFALPSSEGLPTASWALAPLSSAPWILKKAIFEKRLNEAQK